MDKKQGGKEKWLDSKKEMKGKDKFISEIKSKCHGAQRGID